MKMLSNFFAYGNENHARTKLANTKISCVEEMPIRPIAHSLQLRCNLLAVVDEYSVK